VGLLNSADVSRNFAVGKLLQLVPPFLFRPLADNTLRQPQITFNVYQILRWPKMPPIPAGLSATILPTDGRIDLINSLHATSATGGSPGA
jgi:hypothetical protein